MYKWDYIDQIRYRSYYDNKDYLLELMDKYNKLSLVEITIDEVIDFWNEMTKGI